MDDNLSGVDPIPAAFKVTRIVRFIGSNGASSAGMRMNENPMSPRCIGGKFDRSVVRQPAVCGATGPSYFAAARLGRPIRPMELMAPANGRGY